MPKTYVLTPAALEQTRAWNPRQVYQFVMSSRRDSAMVVAVHIGADAAKRQARTIGSCVRAGLIVDGRAIVGG